MDNKKFEKLIDLIINENEEQARELFHDIVVEKSREIYESIMDEEMMGQEDEGMGGQVGGLLDEINAEEMNEEGDEDLGDLGDEGDEEVVDIDADDIDDGDAPVEDAVIRIEDKLDQLMAEFEEIMGGGEEDFGDEEGSEEDFGDEEGSEEGSEEDFGDEEGDEEEGEEMMEAVQLKNVPGLYGSKIGGDNGAQVKSPGLQNSGQAGMDSKPVKFSGASESVPTSPKAPSNYGSKGETQVKDANNWKNAAGGSTNAGKTSFKEKVPGGFGHKTPQGKEAGAGGTVAQNDKSVVESRKSTKRIVK